MTLSDSDELLRQAPPGAVRGVLSGAGIHPLVAAAHEPAVLGFHARAAVSRPSAAGGTRLALEYLLRGRLRQHEPAGAGQRAALLVNVTNDAWFGHSWARYQHFQIARMRAIEAQRPLLRAGQ